MPYIKQEDRKWLAAHADAWPHPRNAGELNYVLTIIAKQYWKNNGANYQAYNDIMGAFDGCIRELYRREIAKYEDVKIQENGDV